MRHIYILVIILSLICNGLCSCCCNAHQHSGKIENFVNQHGDDDYSVFYGVRPLFFRGVQDGIFLMAGIVPSCQGDTNSWAATNIYYSIKDSIVVKVVRAREEWIDSTFATIDYAYVNKLSKRFVELDIYEIWMDSDGCIRIFFDEDKSCLAKFENDSILKENSKEYSWNNISGNWYVPAEY